VKVSAFWPVSANRFTEAGGVSAVVLTLGRCAVKFKVSIDVENAAFEEGEEGSEVARILREVANRFDGDSLEVGRLMPLFDVNGNRVGSAKVIG